MISSLSPPCPRCGSSEKAIAVPQQRRGANRLKLICSDCRRFLRWAPWPDGPPASPSKKLIAICCGRSTLATLRGSASQVRWALTIRAGLLSAARRAGDAAAQCIIKAIADSTWFISNRDRALDRLRWPELAQLDLPGPKGIAPEAPTRPPLADPDRARLKAPEWDDKLAVASGGTSEAPVGPTRRQR